MALSNMSRRERTIVVVLAVIIVVALAGIGVLAARLVSDGEEPTAVATALSAATITPVPPPPPEPAVDTPVTNVGQPVEVARAEGVGPGSPVIITAQALHPGRRYRIEIAAANGAKVAINGSWSQATVATQGRTPVPQGQAAAPQIEFFDGVTPHEIEVVSPAPNPEMWSVSVSAGPANILGEQPVLVITIWDVTEAQ